MLIYTDTILLGLAKLCSAASVMETKQHNMKLTNWKKRWWLYLFNIIIKEVCYERTV